MAPILGLNAPLIQRAKITLKILQVPSLGATTGRPVTIVAINTKIPILAEEHRGIGVETESPIRTTVMDTITITVVLVENQDHAMITITRITITMINTIMIRIAETIIETTIIVTMTSVIGIDRNVHAVNK